MNTSHKIRWVSYKRLPFPRLFYKARPQQNTHGGNFQSHSPRVSGQVPASKLWCSGDCRCGGLGIVVFCFCLVLTTQIMSGKLSFCLEKVTSASIIGGIPCFTEPGLLEDGCQILCQRKCIFICFCVNSFKRSGRIIGDFKRTVGRAIHGGAI